MIFQQYLWKSFKIVKDMLKMFENPSVIFKLLINNIQSWSFELELILLINFFKTDVKFNIKFKCECF